MTLYMCKVEYLKENGFSGHIDNVNYWYRKTYNCRRGKSATQRLADYNKPTSPNKKLSPKKSIET